jgi:transposase
VILEDLEVDVVYTEGTINANLVKAYLEALEPKLSFQKLHLFVDNASFHKALEPVCRAGTGREESFEKIELHFLPTYAPNLNLFERIWGFSKKELLDNQYYATFPEFHEAFCTFFCDINARKEELRSLLTEKFQIIK